MQKRALPACVAAHQSRLMTHSMTQQTLNSVEQPINQLHRIFDGGATAVALAQQSCRLVATLEGDLHTHYPRKLTVEFELEVEPFGHYHDVDFHEDDDDREFPTESPLCDIDHIMGVVRYINSLFDADAPDPKPFDCPVHFDGYITIRPGMTLYHAPSELPYGDSRYVFMNDFHEQDSINADADVVAQRRRAYDDKITL